MTRAGIRIGVAETRVGGTETRISWAGIRKNIAVGRFHESRPRKASKAILRDQQTAKAAGLNPTTTELLTRDGQIPDLGAAGEVVNAAFALPQGAVSDPISTPTGTAIVKVLEKQQVSDTDLAAAKDAFRDEILTDKRNRLFGSYMAKAKQKMKIEINQQAVARVIG